MTSKLKKGTIIIPLIIILMFSFGILYLARFITNSQAEVASAIDSRYDYSTSLSSKLDPINNWVNYSNPSLKYKVYYPKQWVGNKMFENGTDYLQTYERFLSTKINLKITVTKTFDVPTNSQRAKFGNNIFNFYVDEDDTKAAVTQMNNIYYNVELKQDSYFASPLEFKSFFFQVLKKFEFTN